MGLRLPARPPRPPDPPPDVHKALRIAAHKLEQSLGGREALVHLLLPVVDRDEERHIVDLLADPANDPTPLGDLLAVAQIKLATLLKMVKSARMATAAVEAMAIVAAQVPKVAQSVMARAIPGKVECPECEGLGIVSTPSTDPDAAPTPALCDRCKGHRVIYRDTSVPEQKLALELGGLVTTKAGVNVQVNQDNRAVTAFASGGLSYAELQRATDRVLLPELRTRRALTTTIPDPTTPAPALPDLDVPPDPTPTGETDAEHP